MTNKVYAMPNMQSPAVPVKFDADKCIGCNTCVEVCQIDVFIPNPVKGQPPIILHPEECWYCGACAQDCPTPGALNFNYPLAHKPYWRRKETGEIFRGK